MMMKGPVRELIPVGEQLVNVRVPEHRRVQKVHLLRAGVQPDVRYVGDAVEVRVPSVLDHEVVAIDLAD
jgi:hypothetical protein